MENKKRKPWNKNLKGLKGLKGEDYLNHYPDNKVWNKGLKKETDERVKKYCDSRNKTLKENPDIILNAIKKRRLTSEENPEIQKQKNKKHSQILQENPEIMNKMVETRRKRGNYRQTKESREKLRMRTLEQFKDGMPLETREKIRKSNLGKHIPSEDWKRMIREIRSKQIFPIKDTKIEVKIQNFLKQLNIEFFTHQYIHIEHGYQCDIFIPSIKTIIECDGDYWHGNPEIFSDEKLNNNILKQREKDNLRTKELQEKGYRVIRLWEHDINKMELNEFKEKLCPTK